MRALAPTKPPDAIERICGGTSPHRAHTFGWRGVLHWCSGTYAKRKRTMGTEPRVVRLVRAMRDVIEECSCGCIYLDPYVGRMAMCAERGESTLCWWCEAKASLAEMEKESCKS
jgi:hypothetical protein